MENIEVSEENITKITIPIESDDLLYAYVNINNRILDSKITRDEDNLYVEFSVITSELENLDNIELYFVSKDEERYEKVKYQL